MKWLISFLVIGLILLGISFVKMPRIEQVFVKQWDQKNYQRVIALAPSVTETIEALGQAHRLVGITVNCPSKNLRHVPKIGSFAEPNFEAIMALNPDLVVAVPHIMAKKTLDQLLEQGIEVFAHQPDSLDDIKIIVTKLALAFGQEHRGLALNSEIDQALASAKKKIHALGEEGKKAALIVVSSTPLVVAGKNTFPSEIIQALGFDNLATSKTVPWPIWPLENLLTTPPDIIFLASNEHKLSFERIQNSLGIKPGHTRVLVPKRPIFNSPSPTIIEDIAHLTHLLSSDL